MTLKLKLLIIFMVVNLAVWTFCMICKIAYDIETIKHRGHEYSQITLWSCQ